ncbi:putative metallophosphoesterase [Ananas comosus]|uniref:Putative metallophosphoesterase n=1 Tax=Ananas comosus TaxID=4615 RepID=A0A199UX55_ANACO|nr:putative metallophosphoesterase [Ananas comosus]
MATLEKRRVLLLLLLLTLASRTFSSSSDANGGGGRGGGGGAAEVIEVGERGSPRRWPVVWAVQVSDLHFSVFHPERALDFKRYAGPALSLINPSLVLITGDLTDGKSKDLLTMKQEELEWIEYQNAIDDVVERSGLDKRIFFDVRGNHDNFGVPEVGGAYDFYGKYSINSRLGRVGNVQSVVLQNNGWKHLFVGFDSTMDIGLRGPTNLFGHPTDQLLVDIDHALSQWDDKFIKSPVTKIAFGHFPLSFSASADTGRTLKDVFLKHSLSAYLCGHLHTRFGKNLKRHHGPGSSGRYGQFNIHEGILSTGHSQNCSEKEEPIKEFWEWEMGDWRKSRVMRILAIDSGHVSYVDIDFKFGSRDVLILPTFPLDSRFMQRMSSPHDVECSKKKASSFGSVRTLIFSKNEILSVSAKIYDLRPGNLQLILDSPMKKLEGNNTRGDLYVLPWNWKAFIDPSPDRYWHQIEATDVTGETSYSQLRPFSINGLTAKVSWTWKEFFVMGCQWAAIYQPALWSTFALLFSMLLIPQASLMVFKKHFTHKYLTPNFSGRTVRECLIYGALWVFVELSRMTLIWSGILLYLLYLLFFPWFFGHAITENSNIIYMTYRGWAVKSFNGRQHVGVPDVMVIVLPHLCFVVLPTIVVTAALAAERTAYRRHFLSLSGKKEDDYCKESKRNAKHGSSWSGRWIRKLLLVVCLVILWRHWKHCRALVKAYEMNPFIHSPIYCFWVPALLILSIYKTSAI